MMLRLLSVFLLSSFAFGKITIDKIEVCEPNSNYDVSFLHKITEEDGMQILEEGSLNTKVDLNDDIMGQVDVFRFEEEKWNPVLTLHDTICKIITRYLSGIAEAMEKAAGLTETCPYPVGEYKVSRFPLDFEQIDYSLVPRGKLKITATLSNVKTEQLLSCENIELTVAD